MINFTKMQGLGNDFICTNFDNIKQYNLKIFSKYVCDRHFGIGADGVVLFTKSRIADFKMKIFNSDGTEAEMCGNGIRCLAKYLYEKGFTDKTEIKIETLAGIKNIKYIKENNKIMVIQVNMGKPITDINKLPIYVPRNHKYHESKCKLILKASDKEFEGIFLTVGNPHTVIKVESLKDIQLNKYGKIIENYKYFPQKTNVEFVEKIDEKNIKVKVWERGVGETLACGTGAVASAFAMYQEKEVSSEINVELDGGVMKVNIDEKTGEVYMSGPAVNVYEGTIDL